MNYLLTTFIVLAAAGCQLLPTESHRASDRESVAMGERFELAGGETVVLADAGLRITFEAIESDSRCPTGVVCFWEGEAVIRLRLQKETGESQRLKLTLPGLVARPYEQATVVEFESLGFRLLDLAPYPVHETERPRFRKYRALLEVVAL